MADNRDLGKELLKSNGIEFGKISPEERQKFDRLVARDKVRVQRMKWATGIAWGLLVICVMLAALHISISPLFEWAEFAVFIVGFLFWIAVVFTISLYIRSRVASNRQIQSTLMQIQEQLERLSTGDQRPKVAQDDDNKANDSSSIA